MLSNTTLRHQHADGSKSKLFALSEPYRGNSQCRSRRYATGPAATAPRAQRRPRAIRPAAWPDNRYGDGRGRSAARPWRGRVHQHAEPVTVAAGRLVADQHIRLLGAKALIVLPPDRHPLGQRQAPAPAVTRRQGIQVVVPGGKPWRSITFRRVPDPAAEHSPKPATRGPAPPPPPGHEGCGPQFTVEQIGVPVGTVAIMVSRIHQMGIPIATTAASTCSSGCSRS